MSESTANLEEREIETSQDKFGEAAVWGLGVLGMSTYAIIKFIENGYDDIAGQGAAGTAAVAGYFVYSSIKSGRRLQNQDSTDTSPNNEN